MDTTDKKKCWPLWLMPGIPGLLFLLAGMALLPRPGLQHDELFFYGPIHTPDSSFFDIQVFGTKLTCMVMSYSGALKTWLYELLFLVLPRNRWTVRLPALLMGLATIQLTWVWVRRIAGDRAAAITTVLLATDTLFLMTDLFDWGPVALQHLLLMGGLVAVQIWVASGSRRMLQLGCLLWGLGMWDKALMVWPLSSMALAAVCVFPRTALRKAREGLAVGLLWFAVGALPLIWYNVAMHGATATSNTKYDATGLQDKLPALKRTVDGSMLSGYMVLNDSAPQPRRPRTGLEIVSVSLRRAIGDHRTNWMIPAYTAGFLLLLAMWRTEVRRPLLFLLITCAAMWLQMALNRGTGGSAHHVILMWPFPVAFLGIVFDAAATRIPKQGPLLLAAVIGVLATQNMLTTNDYYARFVVNGSAGGWTDAIYPLESALEEMPAAWIGVVDWGILNGLRLMEHKRFSMFMPDPNPADPTFQLQVAATDFLFVQHTDDKQILPGVNGKLREAARKLGYGEKVLKVILDRNGRPVFEIFRFVPADGGAATQQ